MTDRINARSTRQDRAPASGAPWYQAVEDATRTWLTACTGAATAFAAASEAQAALARQVVGFWCGPSNAPYFGGNALVRESLIMAEGQAERFADAARETLANLAQRGADAPIPLPE